MADPRHALAALDLAIASAIGEQGPEGPAYVDFTTDVLRAAAPMPYEGEAAYRPRRRALRPPDPAAVDEAAELIRASRRPLVIAGRAVRPEAELLRAFLERSGALCSTRARARGVPDDAPGFVPAVRGRAIAEADLVITLARNLDFEVAYGSAAIFRPGVRFLRVGRTFDVWHATAVGTWSSAPTCPPRSRR